MRETERVPLAHEQRQQREGQQEEHGGVQEVDRAAHDSYRFSIRRRSRQRACMATVFSGAPPAKKRASDWAKNCSMTVRSGWKRGVRSSHDARDAARSDLPAVLSNARWSANHA